MCQANTNFNKFSDRADTIYVQRINRAGQLLRSGQISQAQYVTFGKAALSESKLAAADAEAIRLNDIGIGALTFFEHGLANLTPVPPAAFDAVSKKIAGVGP